MPKDIKELFKDLSVRERDVILMLFGLDGLARTPDEIGILFGTDKEVILQIADKALSKLPLSVEELKSMGEKAREELKNRMAERKPRRTLSDADSELLNINFFDVPEK